MFEEVLDDRACQLPTTSLVLIHWLSAFIMQNTILTLASWLIILNLCLPYDLMHKDEIFLCHLMQPIQTVRFLVFLYIFYFLICRSSSFYNLWRTYTKSCQIISLKFLIPEIKSKLRTYLKLTWILFWLRCLQWPQSWQTRRIMTISQSLWVLIYILLLLYCKVGWIGMTLGHFWMFHRK